MNNQKDLLSDINVPLTRRRDLLPWWMKMFVWIFLIFGIVAVIGLILAALGYRLHMEFYGFQADDATSAIGLLITGLFILKGIVSYGLWYEKDWAVKLAIADGIIGLVACLVSMIVPLTPDGARSSFRLEILFLGLYLWKLKEIKPEWEKSPVS